MPTPSNPSENPSEKKRYVASVYRNGPACAKHAAGEEPDGFFAPLDCGCMFEQEIGKSDSLPAARMLVARTIKRGLASGDPLAVGGGYVEDREIGETVWSY